jgi:hypothetical protein
VKLFVCDRVGNDLPNESLDFDVKPFCYIDGVQITDNPSVADHIAPRINKWMGSCDDFGKLRESELYKEFGEKFVFYNLDDIPTCLHEDDVGIKFVAMPMFNWVENMKSNVVMVPLLDEKYLWDRDDMIEEHRHVNRTYEYVFVGGIGTSGPKSVRTQRDFVLDFAERDDSLVVDTTHKKSMFHVTKSWKIDRFQREYMEKLSKGRFGFCPVGQGLNSYRVGECMRLGVVPIVVGHKCLPLEPYINWNECALMFDTQDEVTHDNIRKQLGDRKCEDMGKLCIDVWEKYFRPENLCKFLYEEFLEK